MPGNPVVTTSEGTYQLYRQSYAPGATAILGGNNDGAGDASRMYIPIVVDPAAAP